LHLLEFLIFQPLRRLENQGSWFVLYPNLIESKNFISIQISLGRHPSSSGKTTVLKPGPARRVDSGLGPVRVEVKTCLGVGLVKTGRPGTRSTGQTRSLFFLYILANIKRRRFDLFKRPKR